MPDRLFRRTASPHLGGALILAGVYYTGLGAQWWTTPTKSRMAGVDWVNDSWLPLYNLTWEHVAWVWLVGGILTLVGGILSRYSGPRTVALMSSTVTPGLVGGVFLGAWMDGSAPNGLTTFWSYVFAMTIMMWAIHRSASTVSAEEMSREIIDTGGVPVTRQMPTLRPTTPSVPDDETEKES